MEEKKEELPKWTNFICPSCGIAYGINALIKTVRKRKAGQHTTTMNNR